MRRSTMILLAWCIPSAFTAQSPNPSLTREAVESVVDSVWQTRGMQAGVPGLAVAIVRHGSVLFLKGYGVENIETKQPVDPELTGFRVASVSKVFVAHAAVQLASRGRINLHADVNTYLKRFHIDDGVPTPVTMHQLLTHTAGFEDRYFGDLTLSPTEVEDLGDHLARRLPPRVIPRGRLISYSNYGFALAGYVVQEIDGRPFHQYVAQEVLAPLGMTHSSFRREDLPLNRLAMGYDVDNGRAHPQPYTWIHRYPATSMITTAGDMSKYMLAQLDEHLGVNLGLSPAARATFHKQQFTHHPKLPGMAYGFMEWNWQSTPGLWHDGEHFGFQSQLMLFPAENTGLFIAANGSTDEDFTAELRRRLLHELFTPAPDVPAIGIADDVLNSYVGDYVNVRGNRTTFEKLFTFARSDVSLKLAPDRRLTWNGLFLTPIAPSVFQLNDRLFRIAFSEDADTGQVYLFSDWGGAPRALRKLEGFERPWVQLLMVATIASLMILPLLRIALTYLRTRARNTLVSLVMPERLLVSAGLANIGFVIWFGVYAAGLNNLDARAGDLPALMIALWIPILGACLAGTGLVALAHGWRRGAAAKTHRGALLLLGVGCAAYTLLLANYNVLGWHF